MSTGINKAEVNLKALSSNLSQAAALAGPAKIMAVVKADAYGHGLLKSALCLENSGADCFGVMNLGEAVVLSEGGVKKPIYVLAGLEEKDLEEVVNLGVIPFIYDEALAVELNRIAEKLNKKVTVHLKIDTGMNRLGIDFDEAASFLEKAAALKNLEVSGLASHFSESDNPKSEYNSLQMDRFNKAIDMARGLGFDLKANNMANSGAVIGMPGSVYDMVRPGIMLYGFTPSKNLASRVDLEPVLSLKSKVIQVRKAGPGTPVSYGRTWVASFDTILATIPIGYAHGINRKLEHEGYVLIRGKKAFIRGRVGMNLIMADVTDIPGVCVGDEVVLLGSQGAETISAWDLADLLGTIPYEIVTSLGAQNTREYLNP